MKTYKEKYHLKKTQPISCKSRIPQLSYAKQPAKVEKKSQSQEKVNIKRRTLRERYSNKVLVLKNDQPPHLKKSTQSHQKRHQVKQNTKLKGPEDEVKIGIEASEVKKLHISKFSQTHDVLPKIYGQQTSLEYWKKDKGDLNFDIISRAQNFFNKIIKPDNGCVCQEPCIWSERFLKWVDIPEQLINQHYEGLLKRVNEKAPLKLHGAFDHFNMQDDEERQKQRQKCFKQITKDVCRTQSEDKTFMNPIYRKRLQNILKCYVVQDLKVGYVQGMNMILSGILYHVKDEGKSYATFRKLLYSIRSIYLDSNFMTKPQDFAQCYIHINRIEQLLKENLHDVHQSIREMDIDLSMICLPWIISLLSSIVPLDQLHLVYYGFIRDRWNFIYRSSLSIFIYFKQAILDASDGSEVLAMMSSSQNVFKEIDWADVIEYGEKLSITFS